MSSSPNIDNKRNDILILGKGPAQGLEHKLTAEKLYSINFTEHNKMFCLSLHYNGANSYLFVNGVEIIKFKAKDSEIVVTPLCLFLNMIWKRLDEMDVFDFSADYGAIAVDDILDIHKYLIKKRNIK